MALFMSRTEARIKRFGPKGPVGAQLFQAEKSTLCPTGAARAVKQL